ncbi:MAG: heparinase II/III family protein [Lentisphaerae bacterium]|nr:heparinase II/III family protein [Lentisphaerota bacterium]
MPLSAGRRARLDTARRAARDTARDPARTEALRAAAEAQDTERSAAGFPVNRALLHTRAGLIRRVCPGEERRLLNACEDVLAHRFDLLGSGPLTLGDTIDWHRDYTSGRRWDPAREWRLDEPAALRELVDPRQPAEIRYPWDLSNMAWAPSLAAAFALTGDVRYAEAFARDAAHWMDENPYPLGVNWACPLSIALRAVNLLTGLAGFGAALDGGLRRRLNGVLALHGLRILSELEIDLRRGERNNHYFGNLMGLYFLGCWFSGFSEGRAWRELAAEELAAEALVQLLPDGSSFEHATHYHRLAAEMLLLCLVQGDREGRPFPDAVRRRLHRALEFTADLMPEQGGVPQFGDNDSSRVLVFWGYGTVPLTDHRHLLAAGGEFFDDARLYRAGRGAEAEAVWLLGRPAEPPAASGEAESALRTFAYPDGGFYGARRGGLLWAAGCRPDAAARRPSAHLHADRLGFILHHRGTDVLVDPGSYRYSSDFAQRNAFRSPAYHNTAGLDGVAFYRYETGTFAGLWWLEDLAAAETPVLAVSGARVCFRGALSCRCGLRRWRIERTLRLDAGTAALWVADRVGAAGFPPRVPRSAHAHSRFLFGPDIKVEGVDPHTWQLTHKTTQEAVGTFEARTFDCMAATRELWYSPQYGERVPATQLRLSWRPAAAPVLEVVLRLA